MPAIRDAAPEWDIESWLNTPAPLTLASLRGRVVVALAFQMLCPGCAQVALPQLLRVRQAFPPDRVAVIGLHTVFEHHAAMGPPALAAFAWEYRLDIPIGTDRAQPDGMPATMRRYAMRGTPTLLLVDAEGRLRRQVFGHLEDLRLGAEVAGLLAEAAAPAGMRAAAAPADGRRDEA